ncbi:MAG: bifunctional 3,4-dihydroxy-2-butanone-4-phosphate synthase/GTP cyclohydrolase II [Planctomycetes bacterium]|nr:bifunctional 3,4-dihydroxy-2-butanone-4-phosphate synthase/GTP cyclohydrolase II [Planctomycetota bacterium]
MPFASIPEALEELRAGRMIVLVDDPRRENEGDFAMAAQFVTAKAVNFMINQGRGLVCLPLESQRCDELALFPQASVNTSRNKTAFTVSIEAAEGVSTGISPADRAHTIRTAIDPRTKPEDLARPGHVFPLRAREGGVLVRPGHTEAIVDLCRLAGLVPAGVICEVIREDGEMARVPDLEVLAEQHGLKIVLIEDLIHYRRQMERLVERRVSTLIQTRFGPFSIHVYGSKIDRLEHVALSKGIEDPNGDGRFPVLEDPVVVRVHSECLTGDVFHSLLCDCGPQLDTALERIAASERGVLLYMRHHEGRGIGLVNKLRAYELQQRGGLDTVEANEALGLPPDMREYGLGAQILYDLGVRKMRLLTNNPKKLGGLHGYGLAIVEQIPIEVGLNRFNQRYLRTKREKLGHSLRLDGGEGGESPAPPAGAGSEAGS